MAPFASRALGGPTPDAPDVYSPFKNGWVSPGFVENSGAPIWPRLPIPSGPAYAKAADYGEKIRAELAADNPAVLVLDREFETQSVDPMALEPESGLAWYDAGRKDLNLVISVQSPAEMATAVADLLGNGQAPFKPARININFASCGGGFGGRDHTPFPLYVALAGMFLPNRPVRLANNRFEQFQSGIKRHAFKMRTRIGVDRATGKMVGFVADHALDGGGLANFSAQVGSVSALAALGIYYCPKVDLTTYAFHSRGVTAGSMRCYGTLQTMTALEVQVDEICRQLPLDPIEFRRRNALAPGNRNLAGNTYVASIRTPEILDKLEKHPIWTQRAEEKARGQQSGILVGTGVACATKNYGTGGDAALGSVEIAPDGRIAIYCDGAEMGNGIGTAVANRVAAHLGGVADEVAVLRVDTFGPLDLVSSGDSFTMDQKTQDAAARNPRWVPAISAATAASIGAHVGTHAAAEAARVIFRFGLWPAALELWGIAPNSRKASEWSKARWQDGQLVMQGLPPLALPAIAAKAHARKGVTGAMAHAFNRWDWARATFAVGGQPWTADIDALAVRRGTGKFVRINRSNVKLPPSQSQPERTDLHDAVRHAGPHRDRPGNRSVAHRKGIQRAGMRPGPCSRDRARTGAGRLRDGRQLCVARVAAALRGWPRQRAMEPRTIPRRPRVGPAAARSGGRGSAGRRRERTPEGHGGSGDDSGRGRAHQRDLRRNRPSLPFLAGDAANAQRNTDVTTINVTINGREYGPTEVRDELTMNDYLREYLGLTGTKFGCGAAQCLSCAVIVDSPDGTSYTSPTCIVPAVRFNGKSIRTVEGHARNGELSVLQKAFIEHFAFQCGYCTAGFLNEAQVLLERLAKKRAPRDDIEKTIAEALDGHLCRCTGYIKYHEAVRSVILADPQRYLV